MNKSIVYLLVVSSFMIGCGQGFQANLSPIKDLAPFNGEQAQQQQQSDTTRPSNLIDSLQTSSDEEGVNVIYTQDPTVDGNFNNVPRPAYEIQNNEILVQGGNWSANQKPQATFSIEEAEQSNTVAEQTQQEDDQSVVNDTNSSKPTATESEAESSNQNTVAAAPVVVAPSDVTQSQELQQIIQKKSQCDNLKLFDNHQQNIQNYVSATDKLLKYLKTPEKYEFSYKVNCELLNSTAGTIYNNFKKFDTMNIDVLSQGRPSKRPIKLVFAEIIKSNILKNKKDVKIILATSPKVDTSSKAKKALVDMMKNSSIIPILISSEEAFELWVEAIKDIKGI